MKLTRFHAGWAVKLWIFGTVFLLPFLHGWETAAWIALGAVFAIAWKLLPEAPPERPVEPLPFAHEYRDREIPRVDGEAPSPRPSPKGEGEAGPPPSRG